MASKKFEIVLAETAGFCMGVRRAVRMALRAADEPGRPRPIRTCGPLIHNRQVMDVLEERGVSVLDDAPEAQAGTAIIRAHGLTRQAQEDLQERCASVLDATCPHVRRVQEIVKTYAALGYACVVVGDAGHAEVEGVLSYAGEHGFVVAGPEEVDGLPPAEKAVVVAQTTQDEEVFRRAARSAQARFAECRVFDTICRSTSRRQAEVRELCATVEAIVVVGGLHSANTRRLVDICKATGTPTYHVETERDLDVDALLSHGRVGVTAGASTPNWMIRKVIRHLRDEHRRRGGRLKYAAGTVLRSLVNANVYAAGGAAALTLACSVLTPGPVPLAWPCAAAAFFFVLGQQLLNQYGRRKSLYLSEPERADFFMANEGTLLVLGICSSLMALLLAAFLGPGALGLVTLGTGAGLMYRFPLPGPLSRAAGVASLEHLGGSKEIFVGLAWATLAALVPALSSGAAAVSWPAVAVCFAAAFVMAFQRTLALDLGDVAGDQLVGRETLAGVLGAHAAERLFLALSAVLALLLLGAALGGLVTSFGYPLLGAAPYAVLCLRSLKGWRQPQGELADLVVDGQFYLAGIGALAWQAAVLAG